jgi:capsular polysaccharide biosynthesis protein
MISNYQLLNFGRKGLLRQSLLPKMRNTWRRIRRDLMHPTPPPTSCKHVREWMQMQNSKLHRLHERVIEGTPQFVAEIGNGRVFGHDAAVITPDNFVLRDVSKQAWADGWTHRACLEGALPRIRKVSGNLAIVGSEGGDNYYHWLVEAIPRMMLLKDFHIDKFYIHSSKGFQQQFLRWLDIPREKIIDARKGLHLQADRLFVPSFVCSQGVRAFLRSFRDHVEIDRRRNRRIYLSRADAAYRRVNNEKAVLEILQPLGFETVFASKLSASEQIKAFAEAEVVIGPHGAGMTNLVFSPKQVRILEFFAPGYHFPECFGHWAQEFGQEYLELIGTGDPKPHSTANRRDNMTIDLDELQTILCRMGL